jgi:hypothetical protein
MSDDKARVEGACRPVYQWEIDAMKTNVSGTSQKLEANTFDELKKAWSIMRGKSSQRRLRKRKST